MNTTGQKDLRVVLETVRTQHGESLQDIAQSATVLLVFLRHMGCTFCKEAVCEIGKNRDEIQRGIDQHGTDQHGIDHPEADDVRIVFVYMPGDGSADEQRKRADAFFSKYGVNDCSRIADSDQRLYRAFGLQRGSLRQLFGAKSFARGFVAGIIKRHGVGRLVGDGFQMPGVFLLRNGAIDYAYRHTSAADVPDYRAISRGG